MSARILIIEDNPTNMELMVYLLSAFGFTPLSASDGLAGVEAARSGRPDLIICDVHLPRLDGYGVVAKLKNDPELRAIPVLAVTALAMVGDRERLLEAGFDGYIGKPIEPDKFVAQLEEFIAPAPALQAAPGTAPPDAAAPAQATILIVDDHVLNREFLRALLGYGGHRLVEAANGVEALKVARAERPDLVISDILMPNMDGYELVRALKADPGTAATPVIFYTALYREREASRMAADCGVRWVLPKPSAPDVILRTVHEALGIAEAARAPAAGHAPAPTPAFRIDETVAEYLEEVESSSQELALAAAAGPQPDHAQMTERLSTSLSSLQAVSLRLTALIELGIDLGAARDPAALIATGC
ncbi:MAG: response regulator, partial [Telluria sp.]